jgi:raffinose/stachyose/melibiose transport system permease protein
MRATSRFKTSRIAEYLTVYAFTIIVLLPLMYILVSSFKTGAEFNRVLSLPSSLNFINFTRSLNSPLVTNGFINSLIITIGAITLAVGTSALAGYIIARRPEKIFFFIYLFFLSSLMIPVSANLVSIYSLMKSLGLTNNRGGLILIEAAGAIPVGILIYVGFVQTIPRELDEAAIVDGCGLFGRFWWIIVPLLKPALISHAVLSSLGIWNDFLIPLLLINSNDKKPLTLAVYSFTNDHNSDYGAINATLIMAIIPPVIFFVFMQRYFYEGITAGSVKG